MFDTPGLTSEAIRTRRRYTASSSINNHAISGPTSIQLPPSHHQTLQAPQSRIRAPAVSNHAKVSSWCICSDRYDDENFIRYS